jgi:DNA-binding NtrC family response regulator
MESNKKKIFLVDDDVFHLNMMEQILIGAGYDNVQLFENGVSCLDQLHEHPDIIFVDYNMDVFTGFEVLRKIKRYDPNIFVVMVSAQEDIKTAVNALKYGAFDYLEKNTDLEKNLLLSLDKIEEVKEALKNRKGSSIFKKLFPFK